MVQPRGLEQEQRGRSSDIFSLGCVYMHIATVVHRWPLKIYDDFRRAEGDTDAYCRTLPRVRQWMDRLQTQSHLELRIEEYYSASTRVQYEEIEQRKKQYEILTLDNMPLEDLENPRLHVRNAHFGADFLTSDALAIAFFHLLREMLDEDPAARPSSSALLKCLDEMKLECPPASTWRKHDWSCCSSEPELFRVAEDQIIHDAMERRMEQMNIIPQYI